MTTQPVKRTTMWCGLAAIILIGILTLLALPYILSTYYLGLVIQMMIFALFAMSLDC
jgi:ABC-type branched-subunit amino acid transport system permease subunit